MEDVVLGGIKGEAFGIPARFKDNKKPIPSDNIRAVEWIFDMIEFTGSKHFGEELRTWVAVACSFFFIFMEKEKWLSGFGSACGNHKIYPSGEGDIVHFCC